MKNTWKQKLSSRKFWLAMIGFATALSAALGYESLKGEQIAALLAAIGTLVSYILGESVIDAAAAQAKADATLSEDDTDLGNLL